jgi:hypothetical protein
VDGGGGEAESILHPNMVEVRGKGRVGGLPLPHLVEGVLHPKRRSEVGKAFSRFEVYEGKVREVHRPKGLLAYAAAAREYVRMALWGRFMSRVGLVLKSLCEILFPLS